MPTKITLPTTMEQPVCVNIVTVAYNAEANIERTVKSVLAQTYPCIRYIVIDGGSTDGTMHVLTRFRQHIDVLVTEPDDGIYSAMNKALDRIEQGWTIFMNAGDMFADSNAIQRSFAAFFEHSDKAVVLLYGDKIMDDKVVKALPAHYLKKGIIIACHQAMFFRKSSLRYDESMKIYADYDFVCQYYKLGKIFYVNTLVCVFEGGGVSSVPSRQKRIDKYRSVYRHFGLAGIANSLFYRVLAALQSSKFTVGKRL